MAVPEGLVRCNQCGELRGTFLYQGRQDAKPVLTPVVCLCHGIVCRYCRRGAIRRPISNYYEEKTGRMWHTPYFGCFAACEDCFERAAPTAESDESEEWQTRTVRSPDGKRSILVTCATASAASLRRA